MSSSFRIREDKRGGWNVIVNTVAMNGAEPCQSIDELDGLLEVADMVSLRRQIERIEAELRIARARQALFHLGRQKHVGTGQ